MKPERRVTITDIAREAKASTATVSRVLNNVDYPIRPELRDAILAVAERLDYRPNIFSQMLKGGENKIVGVIVPSIANPFYSQLVSRLEEHCIRAGYMPIICSSHNSPQLEQSHIETLERQRVAGVLLSTINAAGSFVRKLAALTVPCVLFDQPNDGYPGSSVAFDFRAGGEMATAHLIANGHRRIAFASPAVDRGSRKLIYEGYKDALRKNRIRLTMERVVFVAEEGGGEAGDYECGRVLAARILEAGYLPDAIVAVNDITAIGIMNALAERGIQVPADVSVIGFDDIAFSSMVTPALTTIRQSTDKTAELAAGIIFERIGKPDRKSVHAVVEPELVERASVRKIHPKIRKQA